MNNPTFLNTKTVKVYIEINIYSMVTQTVNSPVLLQGCYSSQHTGAQSLSCRNCRKVSTGMLPQ